HAPFAQLLHHMVAVGDHLADEVGRGRSGAQRSAVVLAELDVVRILGRADGADLHDGSSTRSSLSPTRMRDWWRTGMSPRAASATPFRLPASSTTKSASSERMRACCPLIDGSYGNSQSPRSRPMCTSRPGDNWITSRVLPSERSC